MSCKNIHVSQLRSGNRKTATKTEHLKTQTQVTNDQREQHGAQNLSELTEQLTEQRQLEMTLYKNHLHKK